MQSLALISVITLISLLPSITSGLVTRDTLRCPTRVLKGGRVRIRNRGRVAKYICLRGSQVLGDKYSTCIRGQWDSPLPVCIKAGCLPVEVANSEVVETYRGALVTVHCDPGYELVGTPTIYCNGANWNDTAPTCRGTAIKSQTWCDFETEDLCGWTHDPNHDFDWRRHNFATPSGHAGTGPSYDHTFGIGLNGHYMYLESSSPRLVNDTARLFSPYFSAPSDPKSCFIFWYHMFGSATGALNVYLHKNDTVLLHSLSGDQGDYWHQAIIPLPHITSNFQIVIEGVRGAGFEGDTAVDDVKLAEGEECITISTSSEPSSEKADYSSSCEDRCFQQPIHQSFCECSADCVESNTCCPDFLTACFSTTPDESMASTTETQEVNVNSVWSFDKVSPPVIETTPNKTNMVQSTRYTKVPLEISTISSVPEVITHITTINKNPLVGNTSTQSTTIESNNHTTAYTKSVIQINNTSNETKSSNSSITKSATVKPLERNPSITNSTQGMNSSTTTTRYYPEIPSTLTTTTQRPIIFIPQTTIVQRVPIKQRQNKIEPNKSFGSNTTTLKPKQPQNIKPTLEFLTPPPVIVRYTVKRTIPETKRTDSTLRTINETKVTKAPSKSKNDVLHPYWDKNGQVKNSSHKINQSEVVPVRFNFRGTPGFTKRLKPSTAAAPVTKWMYKYKTTTDVPPVHAPYAKSSTPSRMVQVIVLACLALLCVVLVTSVILRRRKINRNRLEDDDLDIHFLASDEMLDFTLSRPDNLRECETRR